MLAKLIALSSQFEPDFVPKNCHSFNAQYFAWVISHAGVPNTCAAEANDEDS